MKQVHIDSHALPVRLLSARLAMLLCLSLISLLLYACSGQQPDPKPTELITDEGVNNPVVRPVPLVNQPQLPQQNRVDDVPVIAPVRQQPRPRTEIELVTSDSSTHTATSTVTAEANALVLKGIGTDRRNYYYGQQPNRENYLTVNENNIKRVDVDPVSTFSIDVDTAAYSNLRRILTRDGRLPPRDAVRIEEMINYFDYAYTTPDNLAQPLAIHTELMVAPWNPDNQLLLVGIKGYEQQLQDRPAANLVFLIDVSGSMQSDDKLGLVKKSLQLLVSQMTADDRIALVVYAGAAGVVLDSTTADKKSLINTAIDSLVAGGSTNGGAGIELAYRIAEENKIDGGINRVIIASDGDLNVGVTSIEDLKELISKKRDKGVALTTLGYGTGNYNYSLMEQLADVGNGNASYIDTLSEARKVLIEEMQATLLTIAKDVKIQVEFNPDVVSEYRLLGYENRVLQQEDFRNDKVDAGEIGSGHTVTALYEISLRGSSGALIPDSRYSGRRSTATDFSDELAYVNIRFKLPEADVSTEFGMPVAVQALADNDFQASDDIRFAAAVAGFGQLLSGGKYTRNWDYDQLLQLARQSRGDDTHGYRSEMLKLVELAKVL